MDSIMFVVISYFKSVEFILGTLTNILSVVVCSRPRLRKSPTFFFIGFVAVSNLIESVSISSTWFFNLVLDLNLETQSWTWCKLNTLFNFFSFHWTICIFTCIPLEIYLSVRFKNFRKDYSTSRQTIVFLSVLGFIMLLFNSSILFLDDNRPNTNDTDLMTLSCLTPFAIKSYYTYTLSVIKFYFLTFLTLKGRKWVFISF